jgi:hypothetical protein
MLYLLPDELLVAIVEDCDQKTRKNLSLVSRRLRNPSQYIIFKTVCISRNISETLISRFAVDGRGYLPEVIQNDRLLSYIQTVVISLGKILHHLQVNAMELLFTAFHQMQQLKDIKLVDIPFTTTMLDRLCEVLSTRIYNVELSCCSYPAYYTIQQAPLRIHALKLVLTREHTNVAPSPALVAIIERSSSSIASLTLLSEMAVFAHLGTMPRLTSLNLLLQSTRDGEALKNFLVANPRLVEFAFDQGIYDLSLLPPSALPNLKTIRVPTELIQHLLPGRSVAKVEICNSPRFKIMVEGLRALSRSAAPIVELTLHLHHYSTYLDEILDVVVKSAPRLERMWLSFHAEVRSILY